MLGKYALENIYSRGGIRMMNAVNESFKIKNGPNKDMLFDACKYAREGGNKISISFQLEPPAKIEEVDILAISHEDGSGQSFNIEGYCRYGGQIRGFKAYYNTRLRTGSLSVRS